MVGSYALLSKTLYVENIAECWKLALFSMKNMYTNINITVIHSSYPDTIIPGVCGGSASGKTTVARKIIEALDVPWVSLLSLDSFYKVRFSSLCQLAQSLLLLQSKI